jgi:hypothetical protein
MRPTIAKKTVRPIVAKGRPVIPSLVHEARAEWTATYRKEYEKFLLDTLSFPVPAALQAKEGSAQEFGRVSATLSMLPYRSGG